MDVLPLSAMFIVCGAHISENLEHHKRKDVQRILEDKGFETFGSDADNAIHFYKQSGGTGSAKRTIIVFGDQDFVSPTDGVRFYDSPDSLK